MHAYERSRASGSNGEEQLEPVDRYLDASTYSDLLQPSKGDDWQGSLQITGLMSHGPNLANLERSPCNAHLQGPLLVAPAPAPGCVRPAKLRSCVLYSVGHGGAATGRAHRREKQT